MEAACDRGFLGVLGGGRRQPESFGEDTASESRCKCPAGKWPFHLFSFVIVGREGISKCPKGKSRKWKIVMI